MAANARGRRYIIGTLPLVWPDKFQKAAFRARVEGDARMVPEMTSQSRACSRRLSALDLGRVVLFDESVPG
jgi:hypothetical protein